MTTQLNLPADLVNEAATWAAARVRGHRSPLFIARDWLITQLDQEVGVYDRHAIYVAEAAILDQVLRMDDGREKERLLIADAEGVGRNYISETPTLPT